MRLPIRPHDRPRVAALLPGLAAILSAAWLAGCSGGPRQAAPVDAPRAREALATALDGWKGGGRPGDLKSGATPMTVQDLDWESGLRLVDYRLGGDGRDDDANLRVPVTLVLRDPRGKELMKDVTYVVGTSPSVTVFRELGP